MTNDDNNIPVDQTTTDPSEDRANGQQENHASPLADPDMDERINRLGGEPAPVITPEEFARLQKAGQVHIDARGRVRASRRRDAEAGVSLRKRRAWY
jgi:hypothetical protein